METKEGEENEWNKNGNIFFISVYSHQFHIRSKKEKINKSKYEIKQKSKIKKRIHYTKSKNNSDTDCDRS